MEVDSPLAAADYIDKKGASEKTTVITAEIVGAQSGALDAERARQGALETLGYGPEGVDVEEVNAVSKPKEPTLPPARFDSLVHIRIAIVLVMAAIVAGVVVLGVVLS